MYLHIGNNKSIKKSRIIGIFDADKATSSQITKKFLTDAEHDGKLYWVTEDVPRSFVIAKSKDGFAVYMSPLSVAALHGRISESER